MSQRSSSSSWIAYLVIVICALGGISLLQADQIELQGKFAEVGQIKAVVEQPTPDPEESIEAEFPGGAGLKTDPELETYLKRADLFVEEGRYDLATILWQRVLDESGETVMTRPGWTYASFERKYRKYKSVSEEIERTIAKLPAVGLRQYRLAADGEAHALLAAGTGDNREQALSDVVRLYFMSALGDDAAYELACLRLDRHDFVGAGRLLSRILNDYPDPSMARSELLLRLALANARLGDVTAARSTLANLQKASDAREYQRVAALIQSEVDTGAANEQLAAADSWRLAWGGPQRTGHMPSLPVSVTADTLSEAWFEDFEIEPGDVTSNSNVRNQALMFRGGFGRESYIQNGKANTGPVTREQLLAKWKTNAWLPTGQMLLHDGLVIYKKDDRVVCRDAATGKLKWMSRPATYEAPAITAWLSQMQRSYGMNNAGTQPNGGLEAFVFGDRLNQAMAIDGDLLYTVDGPLDGEPVARPVTTNRGFNYQTVPRRSRTNYLSAYNVKNGKFKWQRSAVEGAEDSKFQGGFMAAPVPHAKFLLVPVSDGSALWLHALEKGTGELAWKTFLCEDPMSGASPWSPVGLSVDGGDAYIATGGGVIFAVDAMSGAVRWAVRYQRSTKGMMDMARFGRPQQKLLGMDGWEEDIAIPHGKSLVVIASDSDKLFALDRRTGQLIWESPRKPTGEDDAGEYFLGVLGDGLFIAGKKSLRRYDLNKDGRMMWEARFANPSYGHGVLTGDAVYMPTGDRIAKVDAKNGKLLAEVGVFSPTKEPVGNLFSDGARLLSIGMARAYALQDLESRMASLASRIEAGDSEAQLQRMRLQLRGNKYDEALADLRAAHALRIEDQGPVAANAMLYDGLKEIELIDRDPRLAMSIIVDAQAVLVDVLPEDSDSLNSARDGLLFTALYKIRKEKIAGAVDEILDVAGIVEKSNMVSAARQALAETVTAEQGERIRQALTDQRPRVRMVAVAGVGTALGEDAAGAISGLLEDESEDVRLAVAIALANAGERSSLAALGKLLDSEDLQIRSRTVQALRALTGQRYKFIAYEKPEARAGAAKEWQDWLADAGQTAELKLPIGDANALLGRTLVALYSQNRIIEYDSDHNKVWEKTGINQPWGADGLPNGNRLIISYNGKFVVELDSAGEEVWRIDNLPGYGSHAHRLDNGNTLITCSNVNKVFEYSPEKKIVWEQNVVGNPQDARRLDNGNTLVALQSGQKVVEIDNDGKVVWEMTGMQGAFAARRLDNGNTLIACSGHGKVVEVTPDKKIIWTKAGLSSPYDAQRLDNGNTLIVDSQGYREVDPDGKVVWEEKVNGALRICRY